MRIELILCAALIFLPVTLHASPLRQSVDSPADTATSSAKKQQVRPGKRSSPQLSTQSREMSELAKAVTEPIQPSVARIYRGNSRTRAGLGLVVSADGKVLTKLRSLRMGFRVEIDGKLFPAAKVIGIHIPSDLAMLKVDATELKPAELLAEHPAVGSWLFTPTLDTKTPCLVGTCGSIAPFSEKPSLLLGVQVQVALTPSGQKRLLVLNVVANSPAEKFGIERDDFIRAIDGVLVSDIEALKTSISNAIDKEELELVIERDGAPITVQLPTLELTRRQVMSRFPKAFSHDTKLMLDKQCGGPIINLEGKVVGINMLGIYPFVDLEKFGLQSRQQEIRVRDAAPRTGSATRNSSLAIPSDYLLALLEPLSNGELAPEIVNRRLIEINSAKMAETRKQFETLREKQKQLGSEWSLADKKTCALLKRELKKLDRKIRELAYDFSD